MRLLLIGDDEDVIEVLSDLSRHFDYFEVSRLDALPDRPLDDQDHVVIAMADHTRGQRLLSDLLQSGAPGFVGLSPATPASAGARAILIAAQLIGLTEKVKN